MIVKVRGEENFDGFSVSDYPGVYEILDPEEYFAPGYVGKFWFAHDGKFGLALNFAPQAKELGDLDLSNMGQPIVNSIVVI